MDFFHACLTRLFDAILYPASRLHPICGLTIAAVLSAVIIVWLVGKTSDQRLVRTLKARVKGHLLEMWIFRDCTRVVLTAQVRILSSSVRLSLCLLGSLLVLLIPMTAIMAQLQARYGYRPLEPGDGAILRITFSDAAAPDAIDARVEVPEGLVLESLALRIPAEREVDVRIGARRAGDYRVVLRSAGQTVGKSVHVGAWAGPLSPVRAKGLVDRVIYPIEAALPDGPITRIRLEYPSRTLAFGAVDLHWLWPFLVLSVLAVFAMKRLFHIEL
ncbi:MAG: hypothetical protein ABIK89_26150 [Planctomycetota bacterium]